ncbi:MAG: histidine phosphatase family protein [Nitrosomonadales bacterium]|nr:histidine phosphatase family protein [Nitrosomonadales bacterium]
MELILWRHAEAEEGTPDAMRPLTEKGRRQAERMAHFISGRLPPNTRILVSPALRAQQTAAALSGHFITAPNIGIHATPQTAVATAGWPMAGGAVMLVGHQPWMGELAAFLMTGHADYWSIKKGAVWWFSRREREGDYQTVLRLVIAPDQL